MRYWFGEKIRAVRERRALTLREVADKAGVSESLVSQIERNRVSPAIDTLLALADALDLDLEYLFSDYRRNRSVRITRSTQRGTFTRPGVLYERLAQLENPSPGNEGIEAYYITIDPGAKTGGKEYGHPGWELGIVQEGTAELAVGNSTFTLSPGDSASFRADAPHILSNTGNTPLRVFWIITPPKGEIGNGG
ncbi:helix-turn-helix domain-containing protein [Breznakiella homolactica]|uniref:Helix-turn-helix transcriptional regulator n=1 Tax=Breznakiella homolactica TaxID=2798577 RepID=A0A7T7XNC8_9SPIR|nr:XRE family transcriptional regulator [Breznakiella homolactica]QQO09473.1 XRE family transcriptional regulator [Breznakiella homolactica]